jgi:hypothetical protein
LANKDQHIDHFLNTKLQDYQSMPDGDAWDKIQAHVHHLGHPVDQVLYTHLSELSENPDESAMHPILASASDKQEQVDQALHTHLSMLESLPDKSFYEAAISSVQSGKRKKRRFALLLLILLGGILSLTYTLIKNPGKETVSVNHENSGSMNEPGNNEPKQSSQKDQVPGSTQNQEDVSEGKDKINPETAIQFPPSRSGSGEQSRRSTKDQRSRLAQNKQALRKDLLSAWHTEILDHEDEDVQLDLHMYHLFPAIYETDLELAHKKDRPPLLPKKRLSPFSLHIQMGLASERTINSRLKTGNIHRDALDNYQQANGPGRNGDVFSIQAGYRFGRFMIKTGCQYSMTSSSSTFTYVYTDIPVYYRDTLKGYFKRPANQSPHIDEKIKNSTSTIAVPVQVYARIFERRKFSVWAGLGSDLILQRTVKGSLFSFDEEMLKSFRTTTKTKISPHISFYGQYHLSPGIAFTGNIQLSRLSSKMVFDHAEYVRTEILPSLRFGILFTPIIPVK